MPNPSNLGAIAQTFSGQGVITFAQGARIACNFTFVEDTAGKKLLTCSGRFAKSSYSTWEQLMSRYQVDQGKPEAVKPGLLVAFEGHTEDNRGIKIERMALIGSLASAVGDTTLTLQMQFECFGALITPAHEQTTPTQP